MPETLPYIPVRNNPLASVSEQCSRRENNAELPEETMNSLKRAVTVSFIAFCTLAASAQVSSTSTSTGPNGKTATRSTVRGGGSVQSTAAGPNGKTATRSTTRGGGNSQTTLTGRNGGTATRNVTGRGTGTVTATSTGPRGATGSTVRTR